MYLHVHFQNRLTFLSLVILFIFNIDLSFYLCELKNLCFLYFLSLSLSLSPFSSLSFTPYPWLPHHYHHPWWSSPQVTIVSSTSPMTFLHHDTHSFHCHFKSLKNGKSSIFSFFKYSQCIVWGLGYCLLGFGFCLWALKILGLHGCWFWLLIFVIRVCIFIGLIIRLELLDIVVGPTWIYLIFVDWVCLYLGWFGIASRIGRGKFGA